MTVLGLIAGVGSEEAHGVVAPVVEELLSLKGAVTAGLVELENRHKLYSVYSQLFKIGYLLAYAGEGSAVFNAGAFVHRKASDVELVDNKLLKRNGLGFKVAPVVIAYNHSRLVNALILLVNAPSALTCNSLGVGVENIF